MEQTFANDLAQLRRCKVMLPYGVTSVSFGPDVVQMSYVDLKACGSRATPDS